jgi:hypothetical protein
VRTFWLAAMVDLAAPPTITPPPESAIEWLAPATCPTAEQARAHIREFLGAEPTGTARARVVIGAVEDGWRAEIELAAEGITTQRLLAHRDCVTLTEAAALVVAVGLDPIRVAEHERSPAAATPVPEPFAATPVREAFADPTAEAPVRPHTAPPAARERSRPAALRHGLAIGAGLVQSPVPRISGALALGYSLGGRWWRVEVGLAYATPRRVLYPGTDVGGRFQTAALDTRACVTPRVGRVVFPLCAGPTLGLVVARGIGVEPARRPASIYGQVGVGGAVRFEVHRRVALFARGEALVALSRPQFHVGDRPSLTAPVAGGRGLLGVEVLWP